MEKIEQVISEIHEKVTKLKGSLEQVETENETLKNELKVLTEKLSLREQEAADFRQKYDEIKGQLEHSNSAEPADDKNEQIDLLVREIDDCINRLKA
tara:strand:+ start:18810 stop:19100 length:291 start_codon:yes stop_codon:yes gene_type:complete